jgi:hypothetical protein
MRKTVMSAFIMLGIVICALIAAGCMDPGPKPLFQKPPAAIPEPETGIAAWIVAVNERNFGGVYDLLPVSKRSGITKEGFIQFNRENPSPFIASGPVITDFFVLEKKVDGQNATMVVGLQTRGNLSGQDASDTSRTVFFTFYETFEEYEWKVWTV